MSRRLVTVATALAGVGLVAATLAVAPSAAAEPGTAVTYAKQATATRYLGQAFDTCTAPPLSTMQAWTASPYRAIGVYVGGPNRGCQQPELTPAWVTSVAAMGWQLLPIYLGLQAPCSDATKATKITPSTAAAQGTASAVDAIASLKALGLQPGSIVYNDMESYTPTDTACRDAVLKYLSGFTKELHRQGYLSGVYANLMSGATHLNGAYQATAYARPDVLWLARWDNKPSITDGFTVVASTWWSVHQRAKQYLGDHNETYGGVTLNIDSDYLDAPVATIARPYAISVSGTSRTAPTNSATSAGALTKGTAIQVICQTPGSALYNTKIWNKLANGAYMNDHYVNTPSATGYTASIPRCYYPYQVTRSTGTTLRSGPGGGYASKGGLASGALAWAVCQKPGTKKVGTTAVWDKLDTGLYVSDYYVATPSKTTYSAPIPRC